MHFQQINNPIFPSNHTFACFLKVGDTFHAYYYIQATTLIYHKTSTDGLTWTDDVANNPITFTGRGTTVVSVWKEEDTWYALFNMTTGIGLATSSDGITWNSNAGNPVLPKGVGAEWDNDELLEPWGLMKVGDTYHLYYNTLGTTTRETGLATSTDLINWTKSSDNPIWTDGRFCVFVFKYDNYYWAFVPYYTTGSALVDIEYYRCVNPTFKATERDYMGYIIERGPAGSWNSQTQDCPFILTDDVNRDTFRLTNGTLWMYSSGKTPTTWSTGISFFGNKSTAGQANIRGLSHG